jgi:iron complex outermembrane receptor protein
MTPDARIDLPMKLSRSLILCAALPAGALARTQADETAVSEVVVTATRLEASAFDVPAAISSVPADRLRNDALGVNLSDDVAFVPGLLARNRNNYAQDQQISIRGIGANSAFGVRGVRIYQDGIPQTGADGQGQVSQFNLDSAQRVEILRGPFSALYGNSSGGVIQIFTADGMAPPQERAAVAYGSFDTVRAGIVANDALGPFAYNLAFTHFSIDGFRPHSSARSESFNGKLSYDFNDANRLAFIANVISRPDAQDPLGLTPAQFQADPYQTAAAAEQFDTRKTLQQAQGGLVYDLDIDDHQSVRLLGYYGHRAVLQFLAIPMSAQVAPTSAGGVVDLSRNFGGADARWSWRSELASRPLSWVVGVSYDRQNELRRGYNNYVGSTLGVQGALRRDENDITYDLDEYTQGTWEFVPDWSLTLGIRHSEVQFSSDDHYIAPHNPDDSGSVTYTATSPVAGLLFEARPWLHLYASYGQGFQTPIGAELAYRPDGSSGLNLGLKPAHSDNGELGAKFASHGLTAEATVFQTLTNDEIVIATNVGGRQTYQNAGRTRRRGAEASLGYDFATRWHLDLAYTYVDAVYSDAYRTCTTTPCSAPSTAVPAGNRLPGVPRNNVFASLRWGRELGLHAAATGQYVSDVPANDVNSVFAPAYAIAGVSAGYGMDLPSLAWSAFVRFNNLLGRHYVGSVIVDDGNSRYFEPGPGFNVLGGITITFK